MNISVVGSGYVGLCTAVGFALKNNHVVCVDIDKAKVKSINDGVPPIEENGLKEALAKARKNISASTDLKSAVIGADITFICVGTPSRKDGSIDTSFVEEACKSVGLCLKGKKNFHLVVVKSTVVPGTTEEKLIPILEKTSGKKNGKDFGVCTNPEFLREGSALEDFLKPDRIIIGSTSDKSTKILKDLYSTFDAPFVITNLRTAEMIKYAANTFLAAKISLINELGNLCKKLDIDTYKVAEGIGHDKRIGNLFLNAGIGFGGSCFSKDVRALAQQAKELGYDAALLNDVINRNELQRMEIIKLLKKRTSLEGKTIAILGLAFKAGTDDIRDSPAIDIVNVLKKEGCKIVAYDPAATKNFSQVHRDVTYAKSVGEALKNADACLLLTEWEEFKKLKDSDFSKMKNRIIIEGRRVLKKENVKDYEGVCW